MSEKKLLTKENTLGLLSRLDDNLDKDGYRKKLRLYCMGGTKMLLSNLRYSSEDVDFLMSREDYHELSRYRAEIEWKEKIRFDCFSDGSLPGYTYNEFREHAVKAGYSFRHLELYFIDDTDFVLTKAFAGREKDIKDLKTILAKKKISKKELLERFQKVKFNPDKEEELKAKFRKFLEEFCRD